jgi:hypothetical protein
MTTSLVVQELVIVIAAKNLNPIVLTPEFLKYSGIVPAEWELARQPMCTQQGSQVTFTNGISIVAQPQRVMFAEAIDGKVAAEVAIPSIARKYVQTLPNLDYQAIGLNPRGYVTFDSEPGAARKYISEKLLSAGEWQEVGTAPVRATINLAYTLERGVFNLSVNEAALRQPDETLTPIILFSGNFSYEMASLSGNEKLESLCQALNNWQADLETYQDIVNTKFLAVATENKAIVPDLFAMSAKASI